MYIPSLAMSWGHWWLWDKVWHDVTQLGHRHGEAQVYADTARGTEDAKPDER